MQVIAIAVAVFILPLLMWPGLTDYNYAKCIVGLVFISILLVLWGLKAWRRSSWTIHVPWLLIPVAGFILAGVLSVIQADNPRIVIQTQVLLTYFVLLLWMIADVARDQRSAQWILGSLLVSASLTALYGVLQYYGIVPGTPNMTRTAAIISSMGNRNHLGGFLCYLFFPSVILLIRAKALWAKIVSVVLILSLFATMLLVHQLGTRVALALTSVALVIGGLIFRPMKPLRANRWWLIGLAGAVAALSVYSSIIRPITQPIDTEGDDLWITQLWEENSGDARAWFWWIGVEMLADHPVTGIGMGNYKLNFFSYKADFAATERGKAFDFYISRVAQAHNDYVQTAAESGAIGLILLLGCLGLLATSLWIRLKRSSEENRLELLFLTGGILAFLAHAMISFPAHVASSSLLFVVFCGLALSPRYGSDMTFRWVLRGWKGKAFHVALIAVSLVVSVGAVNDLRANWLMERGFDRLNAGLYASGEELLHQSLNLDFAPRQTYYYLAIAQIQQEKFSEAEENLEKCMTTYVDDRVYLTYADLQLKMKKLEEARSAVKILLATHPSVRVEQQARYIEAVAVIEKREFDEALQLLQSLALDHPAFVPGLVALGQLYAAQGMVNLARANYETALRLIEQSLEAAFDRLENAPLIEARMIRDEIETISQQRDHVVVQMNGLQ